MVKGEIELFDDDTFYDLMNERNLVWVTNDELRGWINALVFILEHTKLSFRLRSKLSDLRTSIENSLGDTA